MNVPACHEIGRGESTKYAADKARTTPILNPEVYRAETSCWEDIQVLCNPDEPITEELVANVIVKYFWHSCVAESIKENDKPIDLQAISFLFHHLHCFWDRYRKALAGKEQILLTASSDQLENLHGELVRKQGYSLGMLGDLLKTIPIFIEIASAKLKQPKDISQSLDLGTGTGILALAEYICAERNQIKNHLVLGIEKNEYVASVTRRVLKDIVSVITGDTTSPEMHQFYGGAELLQVTNENIPSAGVPLGTHEPFFTNLRTMAEAGANQPQHMFPNSIKTRTKSTNGTLTSSVTRSVDLESNRAWNDALNSRTSIEAIEVGGGLRKQGSLGVSAKAKKRLKFPTLREWYFRWK